MQADRGDSIQLFMIPSAFVLLWSSAIVGAKLGLPYAEPMTFLTLRFSTAAFLLVAFSVAVGARWPGSWREAGHIAVAGFLLQGVQMGSAMVAIYQGIEIGIVVLIVGTQPLVIAVSARLLLGERLRPVAWAGLALGALGVALVVWDRLHLGSTTPFGIGLCFLALAGGSSGALYQKRFCDGMDLRSGNVIQLAAAGVGCALVASMTETWEVTWSGEFLLGLGWLVFVVSFGATTLLFHLIRRGLVSQVGSLFFLVPPVTAAIGWLAFGETLGLLSLLGMAVAASGVALVRAPASMRPA